MLESKPIDEVVFAIPSAPGRLVRMVNDACRLKGIPSRTMPGIYELIGGRVSVSRLREVDITDLLRREPTQVNEDMIGGVLSKRRVLVTGAGGSIGQELCRQIARWSPEELVLLGHGENSIFEAVLELRELFPELRLTPVIADVKDAGRIAGDLSFAPRGGDLPHRSAQACPTDAGQCGGGHPQQCPGDPERG